MPWLSPAPQRLREGLGLCLWPRTYLHGWLLLLAFSSQDSFMSLSTQVLALLRIPSLRTSILCLGLHWRGGHYSCCVPSLGIPALSPLGEGAQGSTCQCPSVTLRSVGPQFLFQVLLSVTRDQRRDMPSLIAEIKGTLSCFGDLACPPDILSSSVWLLHFPCSRVPLGAGFRLVSIRRGFRLT